MKSQFAPNRCVHNAEMQAAVQEVQLDNTVAAGDAFMIFKKGTTRWHPSRSDGNHLTPPIDLTPQSENLRFVTVIADNISWM